MGTEGIGGFVVETHKWGKSVAFWEGLGFKLEFETDHNSGQLRHPEGGPWVFIAEQLDVGTPQTYPVIVASDPDGFEAPRAGTVEQAFEARHWNVMEALLRDPEGRRVSVQAPIPDGVDAPPGHG
jgi:hypothetical protein